MSERMRLVERLFSFHRQEANGQPVKERERERESNKRVGLGAQRHEVRRISSMGH